MQKKVFAVLSLVVLAALIISMGGTHVSASRNAADPTAEATVSAGGNTDIPGSGWVTGPADGEANRLNASGATFPLPLYNKWIEVYKGLTKVEINYAGGGSGQGKKDISAQAVDFAGSDSVMKDEELTAAKGGNIFHIATTVGAIVPIYNVPELAGKDPIKFTGDILAQIYLGKITKWNDPALVTDNPDLANVDQDILIVYRSDGSGTTNNFTTFLSAQNQEWADTIKAGNTVQWPVGIGANGNPGVAQEVDNDEYALGYVELAFAKQLKTGMAGQVKNAAGKYVTANAESISAAAKGIELPVDMRISIIGKSTDEAAWPIATMTWILVYENQTDTAKSLALVRFLWWAIHDGQQYTAELGYAPLPESAIQKDEANLLKIMINGKQALPEEIVKNAAALPTMEATASQ